MNYYHKRRNKKVTVYSKGDIIRFYTPELKKHFEWGKIARIPFTLTRFRIADSLCHIKLYWN